MKMMSSTSMTSTSGTTLISASEVATRALRPRRWRPPPDPPAGCTFGILGEVPLRDVQELEGEIVHLRGEFFHPAREVIVEIHRGNRREQAPRPRDARRGDAGRHDGKAGRSLRADVLERIDDAPYRAEEADER